MPGLDDYHATVLGIDPVGLRYIDDDFVGGRLDDGTVYGFAFGDPVIPVGTVGDVTTVRIVGGRFHDRVARCKATLRLRPQPILKFSMVDVQQGDGMVIETPGGRIVLVDGGDNQLFARHLAARYAGTTNTKRLLVDAMIVTHGDADHFAGLVEIRRSETLRNNASEPDRTKKRVFVAVERVFHNGLAKRPGSKPDGTDRKDVEMFGATAPAAPATDATAYCTELFEDLLTDVPESELNRDFANWRAALVHWRRKHPLTMHRVDQRNSQDLRQLFEQEPGFVVDVHGPIADFATGSPRLEFLRTPTKSAEAHLSDQPATTRSFSASHTINGHSIAFRLRYGNVRFLLTGDLNQQAMARLRHEIPQAAFECEVLKAPHHGSHDFDFAMLKSARPVVSLISSGDESEFKEHIHPRATLVAALGKVARGYTGVIFITELAAFFRQRGMATPLAAGGTNGPATPFFAFERTNFGIVHIRTDGKRVLAFTHSGKAGVNEGYAFDVAADHDVTFRPSLTTRTAPA